MPIVSTLFTSAAVAAMISLEDAREKKVFYDERNVSELFVFEVAGKRAKA